MFCTTNVGFPGTKRPEMASDHPRPHIERTAGGKADTYLHGFALVEWRLGGQC